ncbi:MAG: tetratricopeptide repeat protein [Thiohalomonadales bacterium]
MDIINNFEKMLQSGQDNAMLRFGLGQAYLKEKQYDNAVKHLEQATLHDPEYSAAWKLLGKAYAQLDDTKHAITSYQSGIEVAERKGDKQAAKEMQIFLKRLLK